MKTTKCTKKVTEEICKMLEIAVPEKYAAEANDVPESTFHWWMKQGREGIEPYATFARAVTRARAKAVPNLHVKALQGGKGSAQATWFLERRFREDYAPAKPEDDKEQEVKITITGGLPPFPK